LLNEKNVDCAFHSRRGGGPDSRGCQATRAGYESAPYQLVRASGKFAVRDYPALRVVETPMALPGKDADGSFMRLFRFITGGNEAKQKIAMTTRCSCPAATRTRRWRLCCRPS